jgi:hypothetical protein
MSAISSESPPHWLLSRLEKQAHPGVARKRYDKDPKGSDSKEKTFRAGDAERGIDPPVEDGLKIYAIR